MKTIKGFLLLFFLLAVILNTYYIIPTSSASEPASPSASLLEKLETLKKEVASKAAKLKLEVKKNTQNKAFLGQVLGKDDKKITISAKRDSRILEINEFTLFLPKKLKLELISKDDLIVALGDLDDKGILTAKKVIKLEKEDIFDRPQVVGGVIKSKSPDSLILKTKNGELTIQIAQKQVVQQSELKVNSEVLVVGQLVKEGVFKARLIHQKDELIQKSL